MKEKLSDRLAATAAPGIYFDSDARAPRGFMLRSSPGGLRAWCLNYRVKDTGRERRLTIGDVASWPIAAARERAAALRRIVDEGGDPLGELEERRAAPTVAALIERFVAEELPSRAPRVQSDCRAMIRDWILPALGRLKLAEITREHVEKLHRSITAQGKLRRANAVKSLVRTIFTKAVHWRLLAANPARDIPSNPEHGRERYLSDDELARLMAVLEQWRGRKPDSVDVIKLAMLTGARRGEIISMRWADLDLDEGVWVKPAAMTKQRKVHRVPLSSEAVELLRARRDDKVRSPTLVFRNNPSLEFDWQRIRAAAGLEDVRFHDLRHSFASFLVSRGLSLPIVGAMLGHAAPTTTARYAHLADKPLRDAAEIVAGIVRGKA